MFPIRFASAVLVGVAFVGSALCSFAGDAPEVSGEKLKDVLGARSEVQFLAFTQKGTVVIGGVAPYGTRAASDDNASRVSWADKVKTNWVEWTPATGLLEKLSEDDTPKAIEGLVELVPPVPKSWVTGDSKLAKAAMALKLRAVPLGPKSFKPEILAVSPSGNFVALTNYEDKDDEMGSLVFVQAARNEWIRVGKDQEATFLSSPAFSPDGRLLLYRYQTNGYDGPEPWALISTSSGTDQLKKGSELLAFAVAMDGDMLAVAWSDGSVTLQPLGLFEP